MEWGTLEVVRVEELPRAETASPDPFGAQRFASLVSAYHSAYGAGPGRPVVWLWRRTEAGGPVRLLTVDPALLPPSTRAEPDGTVGGWLSGVRAWRRLAVRHEALADQADNGNRRTGRAGPSIETALLGVWSGPFALAVVAEAVGRDEADGALREAAGVAQHSRQRAESSADQAVRYERAKAWHRELHEASTTGLWRVQVLVGADAPQDAGAVAALATASLELAGLPYVVAPAGTSVDEPGELASTRLLTALCKPPLNEVPGIRLTVPPSFDVTPELPEHAEGVTLGTVLDQQRRKAEPLSSSEPASPDSDWHGISGYSQDSPDDGTGDVVNAGAVNGLHGAAGVHEGKLGDTPGTDHRFGSTLSVTLQDESGPEWYDYLIGVPGANDGAGAAVHGERTWKEDEVRWQREWTLFDDAQPGDGYGSAFGHVDSTW